MFYKWRVTIFILVACASLQAQQAIVTSGNSTSNSVGSMSYTVGQVFYLAPSSTQSSIVQGLQQAFEISVASLDEETENVSILVYPNPAINDLVLEIDQANLATVTCQLYDINGKIMRTVDYVYTPTIINMTAFAPGIYFLKINQDSKVLKIYKIIKK
jgi:hypothetical protein